MKCKKLLKNNQAKVAHSAHTFEAEGSRKDSLPGIEAASKRTKYPYAMAPLVQVDLSIMIDLTNSVESSPETTAIPIPKSSAKIDIDGDLKPSAKVQIPLVQVDPSIMIDLTNSVESSPETTTFPISKPFAKIDIDGDLKPSAKVEIAFPHDIELTSQISNAAIQAVAHTARRCL